ncbi:MAG: hypothetical protein RQ824_12420 [bacterium]|nr:hypothetical protein [bacterium]
MRWFYFILLQLLLVAIFSVAVYVHKDKVILLKRPPQSLAKWYKPENKRQVWLHNMFKLRREMQAVGFYADRKDAKNLESRVRELSKHYLEIGDMVPEWKGLLDFKALTMLQESAKAGRYGDLSRDVDNLNKSCRSCHKDYRAVTAAIYRAPDFSSLEINLSTSFVSHMKRLNKDVNQIKIASQDGMKELALSALSDLKEGINMLGLSCGSCHKKDGPLYPDDTIGKAIDSLEESLKTGIAKDQGRYLGALAVMACARCHGVHRISYDAGKVLSADQDWLELIRH